MMCTERSGEIAAEAEKPPAGGRQEGFTLVEVLVGLFLFCVLAGVTLNLYFSGVLWWQRQEGLLEVQDNLRIALDRLCRELRTAQRLDAQSGAEQLVFYVLYPEGTSGYVERKVRYYRQNDVLYREWKGVSNPLASHVTGFWLDYAPAEGPDVTDKKLVTIRMEGRTRDGTEKVLQSKVRIRK
mgnify:CR=1 FL=1